MAREYALNDTYAEVTDRIIAALERGEAPCVCPWKRDSGGEGGRPRNGASGHIYQGVNLIVTSMMGYGSARWFTFNPTKAHGAYIRKGEKGVPIVWWQFITPKGKESEADGTPANKIPILKSYWIFNAEQIQWPAGSKHAPFQPKAPPGGRRQLRRGRGGDRRDGGDHPTRRHASLLQPRHGLDHRAGDGPVR